MTGPPMSLTGEVVLAHHMILAAVPFLVPTLVITVMVAVMAVRDRRRGDDEPDAEHPRPAEPGGDRPG